MAHRDDHGSLVYTGNIKKPQSDYVVQLKPDFLYFDLRDSIASRHFSLIFLLIETSVFWLSLFSSLISILLMLVLLISFSSTWATCGREAHY